MSMLIIPNTVKKQGNVTTGIITLAIAVVIAAIGTAVAIFLKHSDNTYFYIPIIFAGFLSIGGLIMGTIDLLKGIKGLRVMRDGYQTSCEIVYIGHRSSTTSHGGGSPYMVVQYKSETNQDRLLRVYVNFSNVFRLRTGMKIECYVRGEDCYVNMKKEVRILEAPEQKSIKETIKSLFKDAE